MSVIEHSHLILFIRYWATVGNAKCCSVYD